MKSHSTSPLDGLAVQPIASPLTNLAWNLLAGITAFLPKRSAEQPVWASGDKRLPDDVPLPIALPRETDSLCPKCVAEARNRVIHEQGAIDAFQTAGIIRASILEEGGRVLMRKVCDTHGPFEDLLASDAHFFRRMESLYRGRDFACSDDESVHNYGPASIQYGRGSFLVIDLTNRCNMKCSPCFMDANAIPHVFELPLDRVKSILRRALSFKPRREVNIFFSGGEPTIYPHFLEAVQYAKSLGFERIHVATNGIRFAQEPAFALLAKEAGLHTVFLQFDGVSNESNGHRGVENFFDVKLQALDNIDRAGLRTTLQSTIIRGVNNDQAWPILEFAIQNSDKIFGVVFQPIMFAGRDEGVEDERRYAQRYTLSQLATDLRLQSRADWEPLRDWFPMSVFHDFAKLVDLLAGPDNQFGALATNHHPNQAVMSPLVLNSRTREWVPLTRFFNVERFLSDVATICEAGRGRLWTRARLKISLMRNLQLSKAPKGFHASDLSDLLGQCLARVSSTHPDWRQRELEAREWRLLFVKGLGLQDLYNFDFESARTTAIPVASEISEGEISFAAYNGAGWRGITEFQYQASTLSDWHRRHGRHPIYSNGRLIQIQPAAQIPVAGVSETVQSA